MNRLRPHIFIFFCLVLGFLLRLLISSLVPQPFGFDQDQYYGFALGILHKGFHADAYRLYGYPFLIAPLVYFFGVASPFPWTVAQSILDCVTALLVLLTGQKIFRSHSMAWIGFILYLVNPFTSAFAGVLLSEIAAIFLVTLIFFVFLIWHHTKRVSLNMLLALLLGFLPQVRPSFLFFTIAFILFLLYIMLHQRKFLFAICMIILYVTPFSYTVVSNLKDFHQFAILGVDNAFVREIYTSLYIERALPRKADGAWVWPSEALSVWNEYSSPTTPEGRTQMAQKYWTHAVEIIQKDPAKFIRWRLEKLWYVWEKHYLFYYVVESTSPMVNGIVYWSNTVLLVLGFSGLVVWIRKKYHNLDARAFGVLVLSFFCYISLAHIFSTAEERFSLPAYPLVFLFAGFALWNIIGRVKKIPFNI